VHVTFFAFHGARLGQALNVGYLFDALRQNSRFANYPLSLIHYKSFSVTLGFDAWRIQKKFSAKKLISHFNNTF